MKDIDKDDGEGADLSNFDPEAYRKEVEKLKAESDTTSTKAQTAGSTTKSIEKKFGIPAKITKWGMGMLGKTEDQIAAELAARDLVIEALGLRKKAQPDFLKDSGAEEASDKGRRKAVAKAVRGAAKSRRLEPVD